MEGNIVIRLYSIKTKIFNNKKKRIKITQFLQALSKYTLLWEILHILFQLFPVWSILFLNVYLLFIFMYCVYVYACWVYVHNICARDWEGQKRAMYPLQVKLQAATWVLGTKPRSSTRAASAPNHWPTSWASHSRLCLNILNHYLYFCESE